ncbi:MAG: hypothetical protein NC191_04735 [Muribaculaceae bacterium]|nr:hypothetical protein [Muribaculaceae bacterium]
MAKRLYIQLHQENGGNSLTLPVNPENIDITTEKDVQTHTILNFGEVSVSGYKKLKQVTLSSLLPSTTSYFALLSSLVEELKHKPYTKEKSINMIEDWVNNGTVIRVIIAGDAIDELNELFVINKFTKTVRESTPDINGTIELIEYRDPKYKNTISTKESENKLVKLIPRPISKFIPDNMVAQKDATIYKIAKLMYGDASAYSTKLANLNAIYNKNKDIAGEIIDMVSLDDIKNLKDRYL